MSLKNYTRILLVCTRVEWCLATLCHRFVDDDVIMNILASSSLELIALDSVLSFIWITLEMKDAI